MLDVVLVWANPQSHRRCTHSRRRPRRASEPRTIRCPSLQQVDFGSVTMGWLASPRPRSSACLVAVAPAAAATGLSAASGRSCSRSPRRSRQHLPCSRASWRAICGAGPARELADGVSETGPQTELRSTSPRAELAAGSAGLLLPAPSSASGCGRPCVPQPGRYGAPTGARRGGGIGLRLGSPSELPTPRPLWSGFDREPSGRRGRTRGAREPARQLRPRSFRSRYCRSRRPGPRSRVRRRDGSRRRARRRSAAADPGEAGARRPAAVDESRDLLLQVRLDRRLLGARELA